MEYHIVVIKFIGGPFYYKVGVKCKGGAKSVVEEIFRWDMIGGGKIMGGVKLSVGKNVRWGKIISGVNPRVG